jgi:acyl carrier protein
MDKEFYRSARDFRREPHDYRLGSDPETQRALGSTDCKSMGAHQAMTRGEIREAVAELLSISLGRPVAETESVTRDADPKWDSLKHVQLVLLLEEHFGVQFNEEEMGGLRSSDKIVQAIEEKSGT